MVQRQGRPKDSKDRWGDKGTEFEGEIESHFTFYLFPFRPVLPHIGLLSSVLKLVWNLLLHPLFAFADQLSNPMAPQIVDRLLGAFIKTIKPLYHCWRPALLKAGNGRFESFWLADISIQHHEKVKITT